MTPLEERRQRAREAAYDVKGFAPYVMPASGAIEAAIEAIEATIETATRVKLTREIVYAASGSVSGGRTLTETLAVAFRAAGFEVEE